MTWGPLVLDILLALCVIMMAIALQAYIQMALQQPAFHLWFQMIHPNTGSFLYFSSATTCNLLLGRLGKDGNVYETVAACIASSGFLWWFINFIHRKAIENFIEDCKNFLPGSCPLCTLHRAGAYYKFIRHGAPVPEHHECVEQSR